MGKNILESLGALIWNMVLGYLLRNVDLNNVFFTHLVVVWQHHTSPPPLLSVLILPPCLPLLLPLSHFSFSVPSPSPSSIPSLSHWNWSFLHCLIISTLPCFQLPWPIVSSANWNYILAFKKLLSRISVSPWERKYVWDHLKPHKKKIIYSTLFSYTNFVSIFRTKFEPIILITEPLYLTMMLSFMGTRSTMLGFVPSVLFCFNWICNVLFPFKMKIYPGN